VTDAMVGEDLHAIALTLNGMVVEVEVPSRWSLADALRDRLEQTGTHVGCEQGVCGACTVLLDGRPVRACLVFAVQADGAEVVTVEGVAHEPLLGRLQEELVCRRGLQCGFCTPGFVVLAAGTLRDEPTISDEDLAHVLSSNICRCTGYTPILASVLAVRDELAAGEPDAG
jgi:carbon-monoxide dehydrogenase small subunit